jgi:hypothetical protein
MAALAWLVGGLVPTFLISRIFLWVFRRWEMSLRRILVVNVASGLIIFGIAGFGTAVPIEAFSVSGGAAYFIPRAIWLVMDLIRARRKAPAAQSN